MDVPDPCSPGPQTGASADATIELCWHGRQDGPRSAYAAGPVTLLTDASLPLPALSTPVAGDGARRMRSDHAEVNTIAPRDSVYAGAGFFGGHRHQVKCERCPDGFRLDVDRDCSFFVAGDGRYVERLCSASGRDLDTVLGPVLTLAFALQGIFVLHASAIAMGADALCFLGPSACGKSTTASYIREHLPGARKIVDDMAACLPAGDAIEVYSGFPQSELPCASGDRATDRYRLKGMLWLQPESAAGKGAITPLGGTDCFYRLINSTAGAKLFDNRLLREHALFCAGIAAQSSAYLSTLPHEGETLVRIAEWAGERARRAPGG